MTWNKFLEMVKDNGYNVGEPSELTLRLLRKFWKKHHKDFIKLPVYSAILVTVLIQSEVW